MTTRRPAGRGDDVVVVVGAPRSGTTWLQQLLGLHPAVVAPQETHLFEDYLRPLVERWDTQLARIERVVGELTRGDEASDRIFGLPTLLTAADLDDVLDLAVDRLRDRAFQAKPTARVLVEKTPSNSLAVPLIRRVLPGARFLHIVRDPREVVASLLDASGSWGADWAPANAEDAARTWRRHYLGACEARAFGPAYLEIRYDALRRQPDEVLAQVLAFCGVEVPRSEAGDLVAQLAQELRSRPQSMAGLVLAGEARRVLGDREPLEPASFRLRGASRSWQDRLGERERWSVAREVGPLLVELGFAEDDAWARADVPHRALWQARRVATAGARRTGRLLAGQGGRRARPPAARP